MGGDGGRRVLPGAGKKYRAEGGQQMGGRHIAAGTPEDVARVKESYTGAYLRELLGRRAASRRKQAAE